MNELVDKIAEERFANLLINNPERLDDSSIDPEIISDENLGKMIAVAMQLRLVGHDVTPANIGIESGDDDMELLAEKMMSRELSPGSFDLLIEQLNDLHGRRRASNLCKKAYDSCFNLQQKASDIIAELESKVLDLRNAKMSGIKSGGDMRDVLDDLNWRVNNPGEVRGIRCGFPKIEKHIDGFNGGQLYVIGARPSVGKTALMTTMIWNMIDTGEIPFACSLEMKGILLKIRLASTVSGVSLGISKERAFTEDELRRLNQAINVLEGKKWFFEDTSRIDIQEICSKARRLKSEHNISAVFVDYLQIVQNKEFKSNETRFRVGDNCFKLKQLSEELDVPVIALAQLRRKEGAFQRSSGSTEIPEPELHDLKESGDVEQDADVVMLLHRDQRENAEYTTCRIAKNRNGGTGVVEMTFTPQTTSFKEESYT